MKYFFILFICWFAVAARADLVLEQRFSDTNSTRTAITKLHGDQMRLDQPAASLSVIVNLESRDALTLLTTNKTYIKRFGSEVLWEMKEEKKYSGGTNEMDQPPARAVDTGKSENVAGRDAEIFTWTGARGLTEKLWVDKQFPNFEAIRAELAKLDRFNDSGPHRNAQPMLSLLPGMVLRGETKAKGQTVTNTLVSAKVESVDAAEFQFPDGYTQWKSPNKKP